MTIHGMADSRVGSSFNAPGHQYSTVVPPDIEYPDIAYIWAARNFFGVEQHNMRYAVFSGYMLYQV